MDHKCFNSKKILIIIVLASIVIFSNSTYLFAQEFQFLGNPTLVRFCLPALGIRHDFDNIEPQWGDCPGDLVNGGIGDIAFIIYRAQVQNIGDRASPLYCDRAILRTRNNRTVRYAAKAQCYFENVDPSQRVSFEFGIVQNVSTLQIEEPEREANLSDILGGTLILLLKNDPHGDIINSLSLTLPDVVSFYLEPPTIRIAPMRTVPNISAFMTFSNGERYQVRDLSSIFDWSFSRTDIIEDLGFRESVPEIVTLAPGQVIITARLHDSVWECCWRTGSIFYRFSRIGNRLLGLSSSITLQIIENFNEVDNVPSPTDTNLSQEPATDTEIEDYPQLRFLVSRELFSLGERLQLELQILPGTQEEPLDLYIAVQMPDETFLFFTANPFAPFSQNLTPYLTNISVSPMTIPLLDFFVTEGLEGRYEFLAAFVRAPVEPSLLSIIGEIERLRITIE